MIRSSSVAVFVVVALASVASAGTISGTVTVQAGGAPLAGAEVRAWRLGTKGYSIDQTVAANAGGGYSFNLTAGTFKIDARGPAGSGSNYGDRWYDVAAPNSGGYVGENADAIVVTAVSAATGVDIALEVLGGSDGTVLRAGVPMPSMWVRMERRGEVRIHHNDFTDAPTGLVSFRGMVPAGDYQVMVYDPTGARDLLLAPGPYSIVSNVNGSVGNLTMSDTPGDPNEGNNTANCNAASINAAALHADPPQPWSSNGARIGPLANADVDWFCFTAVDGDRLFVTATTEFTFAGATRRHPWTDPLLSFWRGARVVKLAENDDAAGLALDARLDTGPLTAGCHCAAVTTFGDPNYVGAGQTSTGPYQLRVVMGNRPPVPSIKKGTNEVPPAPATFSIDEGDRLDLNLSYVDADHDVPTKSFTHTDASGGAVPGGNLVLNAETGTYSWVAPAGAAAGSPYTLRLQTGDSEFAMTKTVVLVVNGVDMPPAIPVLLTPADGAVVATGAPTLTWANAADPDADPVTYDLELYADDVDTAPLQTATAIAEGAGGTTSWTPATIPENTRVFWRVRARTAPIGGLSQWSPYHRFLVDTANDPPDVPVLVKPADGETVAMRRPGLSVLNVLDPEDDGVELEFEIARDAAFTEVAWTSPAVPQNPVSATTMTSTGVDLAWGGNYFARVRARDVRGGESDWSDVHRFRLKDNVPPGTPAWDGACVATIYTDEAPASVVVRNVEDVEGEPVTYEVELFRFEDDPLATFPVYMTSAPMAAGATTAIPIDVSGLPNGRYRYFVRAFDGTDASDAIECEMTLELPPPGDPSGGCCSGGGPDPRGLAALILIVGLALARRRRRRA